MDGMGGEQVWRDRRGRSTDHPKTATRGTTEGGRATRRTADRLTKLPVRLLENPYAHSSDCGIERGGGVGGSARKAEGEEGGGRGRTRCRAHQRLVGHGYFRRTTIPLDADVRGAGRDRRSAAARAMRCSRLALRDTPARVESSARASEGTGAGVDGLDDLPVGLRRRLRGARDARRPRVRSAVACSRIR